jgi:hypothetical protein
MENFNIHFLICKSSSPYNSASIWSCNQDNYIPNRILNAYEISVEWKCKKEELTSSLFSEKYLEIAMQ